MTFAVFMIGLSMQAPPAPHYRILSECDPSAEVRAEVAKSTPMEIRFSIAQSPTCYSVTATIDGKQVKGYVVDRNLDAVQMFEKARVAVERDTFNALPPPPAPVSRSSVHASSSATPNLTAPADAGKEASKLSKDSPKKDPIKDDPLKKTPKVEF